jgi:hypothetical protein
VCAFNVHFTCAHLRECTSGFAGSVQYEGVFVGMYVCAHEHMHGRALLFAREYGYPWTYTPAPLSTVDEAYKSLVIPTQALVFFLHVTDLDLQTHVQL